MNRYGPRRGSTASSASTRRGGRPTICCWTQSNATAYTPHWGMTRSISTCMPKSPPSFSDRDDGQGSLCAVEPLECVELPWSAMSQEERPATISCSWDDLMRRSGSWK